MSNMYTFKSVGISLLVLLMGLLTISSTHAQADFILYKSLIDRTNPAASGVEGNVDLTFELTLLNTSSQLMVDFEMTDNLHQAFGGAYVGISSPLEIIESTANLTPDVNPNFDGILDMNMLIASHASALASDEYVTLQFTVEVNAPAANRPMANQAFARASTIAGISSGMVASSSGRLYEGFDNNEGSPTVVLPLPSVSTFAQNTTVNMPENCHTSPLINNWLADNGGARYTARPGCGAVSWTNDYTFDNFVAGCGQCTGNVTVTFTATDGCGNVFNTTATFDIVDNEGPSCVKQPDLILDCSSMGAMQQLNNWLAYQGQIRELSQPVTVINDFGSTTLDFCAGDSVFVSWIATDACGNTTEFDASLIVTADVTAPIFTSTPADRTIGCGETPTFDMVDAVDGCSNVTLSSIDTNGGDACAVGGATFTRTWTAVDDCGNSASISQTITVEADTEAPIFDNVPSNMSMGCGANPTFDTVTATDACGTATVTFADTQTGDACAGAVFVRTWTATDDCGNASTVSQTVTLDADNAAPVFTSVPANTTITCPAVPAFGTATATDDCGAATITFSDSPAGTCPTGYVVTRTFTATDACGNSTTAQQTITVLPQPPTNTGITFTNIPSDLSLTCGDPVAFGNPVATTDCPTGGLIIATEDNISTGDCITVGAIYTRTWKAHDDCGNFVMITQTLTLPPDNEAPIFGNNPTDITVDCGGSLQTPDAFDLCSPTQLTYVDTNRSGSCTAGFTFTRTWTATDLCGNASTFTQNVTTNADNTPPVFTSVPSDRIFDCDDVITFGDPVALDNCGEVTITFDDEIIGDVNCANGFGYDVIRTWTAVDECGNASTASALAWAIPNLMGGNKQDPNDVDPTVKGGGKTVSGNFTNFTLFPNPTSGDININFTDFKGGTIDVTIVNTNGSMVFSQNIETFSGSNSLSIDGGNLVPGVYYLMIGSEKNIETKRFVKVQY